MNPVGTKTVKFTVKPEDLLEPAVDLGDVEIAASLGPQIGDKSPTLNSRRSTATLRRLSELRGKYVLVDAWATWCATCVVNLPLLKQLHEKHERRWRVGGRELEPGYRQECGPAIRPRTKAGVDARISWRLVVDRRAGAARHQFRARVFHPRPNKAGSCGADFPPTRLKNK